MRLSFLFSDLNRLFSIIKDVSFLCLFKRNVDFLEKLFWKISDPKNPMYGEYLSNDQITGLVGLPDDKILSFLMRLTNAMGFAIAYRGAGTIFRGI